MGLLSSSATITRYKVRGKLPEPVLEAAAKGLSGHAIAEIEGEAEPMAVGWTAFGSPFRPDFSGSNFEVAEWWAFSLRMDKKSVPAKLVNKYAADLASRRLAATGRQHLSREEKKEVRAEVMESLLRRVPAVPSVYDVLWNYTTEDLWLFSSQKAAAEALGTLFHESFGLFLVPMYPFTRAELAAGLTPRELELLSAVAPCSFSE
ncbi:MAG: recombination-associated protein RdgC [Proteobacteria bacterium]|nr:recombination-associated protein RdgC [Pseudomonadota bacterium]